MTVCNEGEDTYFDKVLKSALHHGRREKRREMVYILGELRDPRSLDTLKTIMTEDDSFLVSAFDHDASSVFYGERRSGPGHG